MWSVIDLFLAELGAGICLTERPARPRNIVRHEAPAIARGDLERQALPVEVRVALPILAPISGHGLPCGSRSFDVNRVNIARPSHVRH